MYLTAQCIGSQCLVTALNLISTPTLHQRGEIMMQMEGFDFRWREGK